MYCFSADCTFSLLSRVDAAKIDAKSKFQEINKKRKRLNSISSDSDQSEDYVKGKYSNFVLEANFINNLKKDGVLLKESSSSITLFVSTTRINFLAQLPIVFTVARNSGNMIMKFICLVMK